jgi:hypothetical protein
MTLLSPYEDFVTRTLGALKGTWARLEFIAGLRAENNQYQHWGMENVHGPKASQLAIARAHTNVFQTALETPITELAGEFVVAVETADYSRYIPQDLNGCTKEHFHYVTTALTLLSDARSSRRVA